MSTFIEASSPHTMNTYGRLLKGKKEKRPQKSRPKTAFCFFFADSAPVSNGGTLLGAGLMIN